MTVNSLVIIYFFYGLAFFSMGLLVVMEGGRSTDARLRMALRPLAGFGLVHAAHEWMEMFDIAGGPVAQLNPLLYQQTDAQRASDRNSHIDDNERIKEKVQAAYVQADARLFNQRLRVLAGVRFEKTTDDGIGGLVDLERVWQRNPDGSFVRNAAGQRVRRPEAGAANSLAESVVTPSASSLSSNTRYCMVLRKRGSRNVDLGTGDSVVFVGGALAIGAINLRQ